MSERWRVATLDAMIEDARSYCVASDGGVRAEARYRALLEVKEALFTETARLPDTEGQANEKESK